MKDRYQTQTQPKNVFDYAEELQTEETKEPMKEEKVVSKKTETKKVVSSQSKGLNFDEDGRLIDNNGDPSKKSRRLEILIYPEVYTELKRIAESRNHKVNDEINKILIQYLKENI